MPNVPTYELQLSEYFGVYHRYLVNNKEKSRLLWVQKSGLYSLQENFGCKYYIYFRLANNLQRSMAMTNIVIRGITNIKSIGNSQNVNRS